MDHEIETTARVGLVLKIAMISNIPYARGKWQRFDLMFDQLRKLGVKTYIISYEGRHSLFGCVERDGHVWRLNPPRLIRTIDAIFSKILGFQTLSFSLMCTAVVARLRPGLVIIHGNVEAMFTMLVLRPLIFPRVRLVYDMNDLIARLGAYDKRRMLTGFRIFLDEIFLPRSVNKVLTVTRFGKRYLVSKGVPKDRVFVLNELVNIERFRHVKRERVRALKSRLGLSGEDKVLMWHGYVRSYQLTAIETVIRGMGIANRSTNSDELKLVVVGPISSRDRECITSVAKAEGVRVILTGRVDQSEIPCFLAVATVGVQSLPRALFTRYINGVKLAEYIAAGKPVLCSDLEGPSELIDGNGLLFTPDDPLDLATKIEEIFGMNLTELSKKSEEIGEKEFSSKAVREKIVKLAQFISN